MADSTPPPPPPTKKRGFLGDLFQRDYPEVSISTIVFGLVVGIVMNAAITYAGLKIGFTIVGSAIAAVLGFGVLRGLLRRGSILEVNIGQTIASGINGPCSGVIFTVPVLFLIGVPLVTQSGSPNTTFWLLTISAVAGAILGVAFIIPLRKQMIDIERLRFPSATAVGAILKSPGAGAKKSIILVVSIIVAALLNAPAVMPQIRFEADVNNLDELVHDEKISYEDALRTRMIAGWIESQDAPDAVLAHGEALVDAAQAKAALDQAREADADAPGNRALEDAYEAAKQAAEERKQTALAQIKADTADGAYFVSDYRSDLALRAYIAAQGAPEGMESFDWDDLRSRKAGWATAPLWGYSDLNLRASREIDEDVPPVDYAYNGVTPGENNDPVLERSVDHDRNGRPDLLVTDDRINVGRMLGLPPQMQLIFAIAPFALGAGYLTGRAGLYVLAGGVLAYLILTPTIFSFGWMPETVSAYDAPTYGFLNVNRPLGIGLLLGGAMMGVLSSMPAIREALRSIIAARSSGTGGGGSDELGFKVILAAAIASFIVLFLAADFAHKAPINSVDPVTQEVFDDAAVTLDANGYTIGFATQATADTYQNTWDDAQREAYLETRKADKQGVLGWMNPHLRAAIIALIGAAWIWFAGIIIAQCTGMTDWSPISGMALITIVLVLVLAGRADVIGALIIGVALCVAITLASDMMADLKTGYIVGAQPKRQQALEMVMCAIGPFVSMFTLLLIAQANLAKYGVPMGAGTDTTAPQAQALQAIITGVQGGDMPYMLYAGGAVMGALLGLGAFAGLGVLVGLSMYLPMYYIATYGVGCVINMLVSKTKGKTWAEEWGVPVAAGFIVGDALLALGVNLIVLAQAS
ncbi:MAG: OPT/YSL family transporter [Phycisphaerales bacterium]